jgi:anti-anti-sigma factor
MWETNVPSADILTVKIQRIGNVSVFHCSERVLDGDEEQLHSAISSQSRSGPVVLDLRELSVLDSAWLGTLMTAAACGVANGTQLKLMNLRPSVEAMLRQNNLLAAFEICSPTEVIALWCRAMCCGERVA